MRAGYREAVRLLEEMQTLLDLGETHIEFAVQLRAVGDPRAADRELALADEIFASIGAAEASEAVWEATPARRYEFLIANDPRRWTPDSKYPSPAKLAFSV